MKKKRIALVGLGAISQSVHLPIIARLHDLVDLVAVVDLSCARSSEIASANGGIASFQSVQELLDSNLEIDGAVIASGGTHIPDTRKLLEAGIPVLVEKPLGYSRAEHESLNAVADSNNLRVGYMKEYDPAVREAIRILRNVKIRSVDVEVLHPADNAQLEYANIRPRASDVSDEILSSTSEPFEAALKQAIGVNLGNDLDRLYPNVILGSVIHDIALLRVLVGGIGSVTFADHYGPGFPGSLFLRGQLLEHNAPWNLSWQFIPDYPQYTETITIHHEKGTVRLVFGVPYILNVATRLEVASQLEGLGVDCSVQTWPQLEAFETEWRDFISLLDNVPRTGSSLHESDADIRVGQEILRALAVTKGVDLLDSVEASSA